jgi:Flp pilus assembly protein TadD
MARRAVDADPDYAFAWAVLGFLTAFKFPLGISTDHPADIQASLAATGRALELDSRDPMALTAHGIALQYAGRAQESLPYLQRSLRLNPSDTLTHCYYGRGMMFGGKPELGLAHFDRFQRLNPDDPAAHMAGMYHGVALMFMQHWATAEAVAREANAAAGGRNPWVWATLAIVLGGQGRVTEARAALDELARVTPHWNREFVQGFLEQCQADPVLMKPIAAILQSIWAA